MRLVMKLSKHSEWRKTFRDLDLLANSLKLELFARAFIELQTAIANDFFPWTDCNIVAHAAVNKLQNCAWSEVLISTRNSPSDTFQTRWTRAREREAAIVSPRVILRAASD
jgi:hypothetical protein